MWDSSVEGWVGEDRADVWGEVGGVQVSSEDSEEVAGVCRLYVNLRRFGVFENLCIILNGFTCSSLTYCELGGVDDGEVVVIN